MSRPSAAVTWILRGTGALPRWPVVSILAVCISVAIGTSGYLLWTHMTSSPIAGCGDGGGWVDCEGVASSRWSVWFGIPVSLLALAIYVFMAAALVLGSVTRFSHPLRKIGWVIVTAAVFAAGMSAVWFIAIQLLVLKHICLYCMVAHSCGLVATVTLLVAGPLRARSSAVVAAASFVGLLVLVSGQWLAEPPATFEIERFEPPAVNDGDDVDVFDFAPPGIGGMNFPADRLWSGIHQFRWQTIATLSSPLRLGVFSQALIQADGLVADAQATTGSRGEQASPRVTTIQGGKVKLKVSDWPHIGPSDAKYVVVEMFDYGCPPCRETFQAIRGAQQKLADQVAIVLLPVPMNADCNPAIKVTGPNYIEACDLAKLAVAVWRVDAEAFAELHVWMMQGGRPPSYAKAVTKARQLVDSEELQSQLASGVPGQYIAQHVALYRRVGSGTIPKLMFPRTSVVGKFTSVDGMVDLIQREGR